MTTTVPLSQVRSNAVFRGMNDPEIRQLVDVVVERRFQSGEVVLREGKATENLWVVLEGRCEVFKQVGNDGETILATLQPGQIFGEMSFFMPAPHSASVRALGPLRVLRLDRTEYDRLIEQGSSAAYKLAYNALRVMADRLRRMDERIADLLEKRGDDGQIAEWHQFRSKLYGSWNI